MRPPQLLNGRYRMDSHLGSGGMSVVWKAHDQVLDRDVAVKLLAGRYATDPAARERVRAEAQAAARLWHPNVTSVFDYGEAAGPDGQCLPYVVMELLPGTTLADRMRDGPLPVEEGLRICAEVAAALNAAHDQHLVHRDVKPSNVMLTPSGAKVVDFGLAAVTGAPGRDANGMVVGTPAYLAPERLTGGEVVSASDIYALGLLLYQALTNHLPWEPDTTTEMLRAHAYVEPSPLPHVPGLPEPVYELCRRCLAKDPEARPPAGEVHRILTAAAAGIAERAAAAPVAGPVAGGDRGSVGDGTTQRVRPAEPAAADGAGSTLRDRRRLVLLAAAALVVLVVLAAFVWPGFMADADGPRPRSAASPGTPNPTATGQPGSARPGAAGGVASGSLAARASAGRSPELAPGAAGPSTRSSGAGPGSATSAPPPGGAPPRANPTGASTPSASAALVRSVSGGQVTIRCVDGDQAEVVDVQPALGFVESNESVRGPADEVRVVFEAGPVQSVVTATCRDGTPVFT